MKWQGINVRTSDVDSTSGVAADQANARMRVEGELQRRWGMIPSGQAKQSSAILNIASSVTGNFLTFDLSGGTVSGYGPMALPIVDGPKRKKPIVVAGVPAAPFISGYIWTPAVGAPSSNITLTVTYTYDGLSGPLTWTYPSPNDGGGNSIIPDFGTSPNSVMNYFIGPFPAPDGFTAPPPGLFCTTAIGPLQSNNVLPVVFIA